jgi:hypothetical protein
MYNQTRAAMPITIGRARRTFLIPLGGFDLSVILSMKFIPAHTMPAKIRITTKLDISMKYCNY